MSCVIKIFPSTLDGNLSDYPQQTTIHGVKYLANRSRPLVERIFWIVTFIISISLFGFFVYKIIHTWLRNPVMIIEQNRPTHIFKIPFPAVTICPQFKIKRDKLDLSNLDNDIKQFANYTDFKRSDYGKKLLIASQICNFKILDTVAYIELKGEEKDDDGYDGENILHFSTEDDWFGSLQKISPSLDEVFVACQMANWNSYISDLENPSKINCLQLFSTVITNEGVCFTFNTIGDVLRVDSLHNDFQYHNITRERDGWDPEKGYTKGIAYPYKGIVKGTPAIGLDGLKFVLNANMSDVTPFCSPPSVGYKIAFHSPSTYPQTYDHFIELDVGKAYKIEVIPKTIETSEELRSFEPEVRQCYFNDERKLQFYTFYNLQNCRLECYANYTNHFDHGVPFSSPRDSNTTNFIMPYSNYDWDLPEFVGLLYEHYKLYGTPDDWHHVKDSVNCNCLPECNAINYENKIIQSNDEFLLKMLYASSADGHDVNISTTIEILFQEPNFMGEKRVPRYTFEIMLSDFGGLLGLFMGGSVLSLFELFYFLAIRNFFNSKMVENG